MFKYMMWNSVSAFILAYLIYFQNIIPFVVSFDPTFVTFGIFGLYTLLTGYLGWKGYNANFIAVKAYQNLFPYIGLCGTIVGTMILLLGMAHLDPSNTALFVKELFLGVGRALITTLFGVLFWLIMKLQLILVFEDYTDE